MSEIRNDSQALRALWHEFKTIDGANQAVESQQRAEHRPGYTEKPVDGIARERADGIISDDDLQAVVDNDGFSERQRAVAHYLLENRELLGQIDGADAGGDTDNRIARGDVVAFIDAHRGELPVETQAIADAQRVVETGKRDNVLPGNQKDDHDARLVQLAEYMANPRGDAGDAEAYRQALLEEVLRLDPASSSNDRGAPVYWLQRERLEQLGPDGEGRISEAGYDALHEFMPLLPTQLDEPAAESLRVMTLNVSRGANNLEPWADAGIQGDELDQVAQGIIDGRVDVASLQEVFEGDAERIAELIEEMGGGQYEVRFDQATEKPDTSRLTGFDNNKPFGNAILVRTDGEHALSIADVAPIETPLQHDGDANRSVAGYGLTVDGQQLTLFNTHATTKEDSQNAQIDAVLALAAEQDGAVLVTGDFNVSPGAMTRIRETGADGGELNDLWRSRPDRDDQGYRGGTGDYGYGKRIDYMFGSDEIDVAYAETVNVGESDHAAVVMDIRLPPGDPRV